MKIVNSIMPMSDIEALAANGQKLRVAVTKTSAQGESAQSATPNLMSFSTDENSIWFNGKKYGVYILKGFENLSTDSHTSVIQSFLGDFTYDRWVDAVNTGNIVFVKTNNILTPASVYANNSEGLNIMFVTQTYTYFVSIHYSIGSGYSIGLIQQDSLVRVADVNNTLTNSSTDKPLSAAMGKKLQDEKLAKTDVVNNLTTTDTSKALSAAQGKALNDKISALGSVYRIKGSKTNISEVLALTDAKVGDAWNVTNAFTFGGKPYPANTNVVCITATSTSDHDENNWDPIGGTVDLSPYAKKSDISYTTDLPDSLVVPQTIGGINKGTKVSDLEGSTISQMFDNLLFPEVQPTIQDPSATIHFKDTFSSDGVYEVGTAAPIAANFNTSFNRGTCTVVGQANKNRAGNLDSGNSFIYYGGNTSSKTLPAKVTLGTMQYNYHAAYAQGDTLVTSKGNKASVTPNPLPAGSVNSSNLTIFGTYPYYCNGQSASSSSGDSNFPTSATPDTKLPLYKWTDTLVGAKFASEAATGTRMQFMYSNRKKVTKVEFYNSISGKWETFDTSNYNAKSGIKTYSVQGTNETYNILTTTGPLSGSVQYRFTMTNA
uniref:hypothetical protein n=1 Tax=Lachnospira eligens TaxID=39485 RepID=UPI00402811D1